MNWGRRLQRRIVIRRLRANLAFFGVDVSGMSDTEVERLCEEIQQRLSRAAQAISVSVLQASEAFRKLGEAIEKAPRILEAVPDFRSSDQIKNG